MKTHIIWLFVSLTALIVGTQFGSKKVVVVEKPVEIVRTVEKLVQSEPTKEVLVGKPTEVMKEVPVGVVKTDEPKSLPSPTVSRGSVAEREKLHQRYDPFLVQLGLSPAQMERFVELKLAIYEAQKDLQVAVEQHGVQGGTAGVQSMRSSLTKPMWDEIRLLLGPDGYQAYSDYERMSGTRPMVAALFRASGVGVSDQQADYVTRLVITNTEAYRAKPTDISLRTRIDWNAVARGAEAVLTPAQIEVLKARAAREPISVGKE